MSQHAGYDIHLWRHHYNCSSTLFTHGGGAEFIVSIRNTIGRRKDVLSSSNAEMSEYYFLWHKKAFFMARHERYMNFSRSKSSILSQVLKLNLQCICRRNFKKIVMTRHEISSTWNDRHRKLQIIFADTGVLLSFNMLTSIKA